MNRESPALETPPSDDDVAKYAQLELRDYCVYAVYAAAFDALVA